MRLINKFHILVLAVVASVTLVSCGEYARILKSTDVDEKYEFAKVYFARGKYNKAATLLGDVAPIYRGTEKAEEAKFMLAESYFYQKDYLSAGEYYTRYVNDFPRGKYVEDARYKIAYGDYLDSPDARLDQTVTKRAIKEIDSFVDLYPRSEKSDTLTMLRMELTDKLCYKEYLSAKLYLNLGTYLGNNYESAIITARNAINDYPYSKWREDLSYVIFRAKYEAAILSVSELEEDRLREASDEYYNFINEFGEGKYKEEIAKCFEKITKKLAKYAN